MLISYTFGDKHVWIGEKFEPDRLILSKTPLAFMRKMKVQKKSAKDIQNLLRKIPLICKEVETMRELTFKGFARYYVKSLSKYETENLTKLVEEATTENARLVEPLLLYAMCANKEQVLLSRTKDEKLYKEYYNLITNYTTEDMYELFEKN